MARRLNFAPREIKRQDNRESPGESCDNMNNTQVKEISAGAPLDAGPVEVLRIPFLSTGNRTIDKAFSIACGDLAGSKQKIAQHSGNARPRLCRSFSFHTPHYTRF